MEWLGRSCFGIHSPLDQKTRYSQVHQYEGAHHQHKPAQAGVEVNYHEQDTQTGSRVHPIQPITLHLLLVLHHRPSLCVHLHVLIGRAGVDERSVRCWILIGWKVVDWIWIG